MPREPRKPACDQQQFADFFERYKNLVYKTAYLMLADSAEAEEVLQEIFVRVYRSLSEYDPHKGAISTWLHRITINYCLSLRRKQRPFFEPLEEDAAENRTMNPPGAAFDDRLPGLIDKEAVLQAINSLSDRQRSVVILRYYWKLPYLEIAQVLEIPLGTVKSRIDLAIRSLRSKLSAQEESTHEL